MTEVTLHPAPRLREVVLEQIRALGLGLRREALVVAVVLAIGTVMIGGDIMQGGAGFDARDTFPTALISFLFPFAVWRSEKRFGPSFLWTLPVDRRQLALAKAFAGWVWFMAAIAVFAAWLLALGAVAGVSTPYTVGRIPLVPTAAMYFFGSAVVIGLRHPLRWLFGAAGLVFLLGNLSDIVHRADDSEWDVVPLARGFFSVVQSVLTAWRTLPPFAQQTISTFLWFGAGLAVLWLAASRQGERRRP